MHFFCRPHEKGAKVRNEIDENRKVDRNFFPQFFFEKIVQTILVENNQIRNRKIALS
jgi:hypothetical protein